MDEDQLFGDYIELDFHNMDSGQAIDDFISAYNSLCPGGTIKLIHGYGSTGSGGIIRNLIRTFLKEHSDCLVYECENEGCTLVYPKIPLSVIPENIAEQILEYCDPFAKAKDKILGKFRRYGDPKVEKVLDLLVKQKMLRLFYKGKYKYYEITKNSLQ